MGIPKHLLTTLKMMNLAEENLKWSLRENDKGVLLKLVWNKRGRSKNWLRPRLNRCEDPTPGRDLDSCSSGEDKLSVASYKANKDGSQKVQKRVKSKSPCKQLRDNERSRQFCVKRRLFEEGLKKEMQEETERLNRHEEGPNLEMKAESEPEKTDHGEDFYFRDTAEISSNAFETVDTESTTENEHDTNCIEIQPSVSIDPTDHDNRLLVKLSQILQQTSVIESFHPAPSSMSDKAQVRSPSRIPRPIASRGLYKLHGKLGDT